MVNYGNGKVYKIESINTNQENGLLYIGSTCKDYLFQRFNSHKADYKQYLKGIYKNHITSFNVFEKYGIENCTISLLEFCPCNSKDELLKREAHYIKTLKNVNKNIPLRKNKEYRKDNIENIKRYFLGRNNIKINCQCGSIHSVTKTFRHLKTKKHLKFINETVVEIPENDL